MKHDAFSMLLVLTLIAVVIPLLVRRLQPFLRVPIVVGEIAAGILMGRSGLHVIHETPAVTFLSDFGFIFLMFLSGLELDFTVSRGSARGGGREPVWRRPAWLASANFGLTLLLAMGIGSLLWAAGMTRSPILLGLILSTTSLGIVVPVLKERDLMRTTYGQCLLMASLISDFVPMLLLGLVISMFTKGFSWNLLLFVVLLATFAVGAKISQWTRRNATTRQLLEELSHATAQIRIRGTFALIALWVVLAGSLGVEVILGAFMAGAIIAQSRRGGRTDFEKQLDAIGYGFFIPIFFIMIGARFDLAALSGSARSLWLAPALIISCYGVNLLPALALRALFSWRECIAGGCLLASRLSLAIAASAIALDLGLISSGTNSAIIVVAIVTCTCSPILFNRLLPSPAVKKRHGTIIFGTDFLAEMLGKRLAQSGEPVTYIGRDRARLEMLKTTGRHVIFGRPDDEATLQQAGATEARALIGLSSDDELVAQICRAAREQFTIPSVVARAEHPEQVRRLRQWGVHVVQPATAMALALEGALHFPEALTLITEHSDEFELADAALINPELVKVPLRQLHLPGEALVLGIRREGEAEVIVPNGDTVLRKGDILMLCGNPRSLAEAHRLLAGPAGGLLQSP